MSNNSLSLWAAVLLLVGGLVHLIPGLYSGLTTLTGGFPWIQVVVGILSVIVALVMFAGDKKDMSQAAEPLDSSETPPPPPSATPGSEGGAPGNPGAGGV